MLDFSKIFSGELVTETMLIHGDGSGIDIRTEMADFLSRLKPAKIYLAIPTRPPAEAWVRPPLPEDINNTSTIRFRFSAESLTRWNI